MQVPQVKEWMQPTRFVISPRMDVREAIDKMVEQRVFVTPVVDADERIVGLLSEKDCLRILATTAYDNTIKAGVVADYMSEVKITLRPNMDMFHAAQQFLQCNFPTLPVLDEEGLLVGRLRRQDMLRCIQAYLGEIAQAYGDKAARSQAPQRPRGIQAMQETAGSSSPANLARRFTRNR